MTSEAGDPRKLLERERDRLDALLQSNDAWRALSRLDSQAAGAGLASAVSAIDPDALRDRIEQALAGVRVYQARRKIADAITLLGAEAAVPAAARVEPPPIVTIAAVAARATPPAPADDLTLIRGIDAVRAAKLAAAGIDSFAAIAAWCAADVQRVATALGLDRTIQRQNWIEQAALIVARRRARSVGPPPQVARASPSAPIQLVDHVPARPVADLVSAAVRRILANAKPPVLPQRPPASIIAAPVVAADDLTALRGLDARTSAALAAEGITSYAAIARWSTADIARLRGILGPGVPLLRAEWIEQAAMLAAGQPTRYARTRSAVKTVPLVPRPALTAVARDEGLACALRRMWPSSDPAQPAPAPMAGSEPVAASRPSLFPVVVLPPQPLVALPVDAPRTAPIALVTPPLALQLQSTLPDASDVGTGQSPAVVVAAPQDGDDSVDSVDIDYSSDSLFDVAAMNFAEADVQIVAAAPSPIADEADHQPRPLAHGGGAGSLQSRLRKASDRDDEFDARGYAAYRSAVEEAAVEIVHRGGVPGGRATDPSSPPSGREDGEPRTVRRFLKALTGQDR